MKPTEEVLQDLTQSSNVSVHSDDSLVGKVEAAIAADDEKRKENENEPLRRKPVLVPIRQTELPRQFEVTLWDVLHRLARATSLSWRGAGRGLAEHWGALKYTQALAGGSDSFLGLTDEGHRIADHYKSLQSGELGVGFALTFAEHMLRHRFPDHSVTIIPAGTALRAGWALTSRDKGEKVKYRYRPQYFAEIWRPGEPSFAIPLACKGNHGNSATSADQLASASAHAEAVHIGAWNKTPSLLFSTELPTDGGTMTVHALQAPGHGGRLSPAEGRQANLNAPPFQANVMPDIHPPAKGLVAPDPVRGCHVQPKDYAWFHESLAHTTAAGLMAFTGSGRATARHLTDRQGRKRFTGLEHAASTSVQDAAHTLLGIEYVGTDHVFRLNGPRVEAFSGVDKDVFRLLARGDVEEYRAIVHAGRHTSPRLTFDKDWGGPVSVHADGSVFALRLLPGQDEESCQHSSR
ncbi:hypothetical protein ACFU6I_25820 [Streptomyces sp. NPDC057486]|uniref:hypothetical protein n=1 Tax=Streptomyces sp. NPDC057486 TaxID=3346145 RepID=UPI0036C0F82B